MLRPPGCSSKECSVNDIGNPACDPFNFLDFNEKDLTVNFLGLVMLFFFYRFVSLALMMYVTWETDLKNSKKPKMIIFENRLVERGNPDQILKAAGINFVAQLETVEEYENRPPVYTSRQLTKLIEQTTERRFLKDEK